MSKRSQISLQPLSSSNLSIAPTTQRAKRSVISPAREMRQQGSENPMLCKICLQIFNEPYITNCGHTFCRICITQSLQFSSQCPVCESSLDAKKMRTCTAEMNGNNGSGKNVMLSPNYAVAALLAKSAKHGITRDEIGAHGSSHQSSPFMNVAQAEHAILNLLNAGDQQMSLESLERIQNTLQQKRLALELNDVQVRTLVLHDFLDRMIEKREQAARQIQSELDILRQDRQLVRASLSGHSNPTQRLVPDSPSSPSLAISEEQAQPDPDLNSQRRGVDSPIPPPRLSPLLQQFIHPVPHCLTQLRQRMIRHSSSLESAYFAQQQSAKKPEKSQNIGSLSDLDEFATLLKNMYKYGDVKVLATLNYNLEACNQPSIVSSIEFDKDGDFFVVAGVTKMIKLYDYNAMMDNCYQDGPSSPGLLHQPIVQLRCNSKISNISWNPYNKTMLASSDYDGTVQLWDTAVAKCTRIFEEHEKRCWTVQFNNVDPHLMASGSDDGKVKLWSVLCPQSLCAIDAKVNVCCVYFSPKLRNQLVFGSSDHCVHLYDLRQLAKPVNVFRGHRKAVSYVKYVNENEVISASTDSNLRLWEVNTGKCLQTLRGHQNEKNFVGLATDGTHVVCGSENNHLYLYYKSIADPLLSFDFGQRCVVDPPASLSSQHSIPNYSSSLTDSPVSDLSLGPSGAPSWPSSSTSLEIPSTSSGGGATGDFVSAVCWRRNTGNNDIVLAANSQGQTFVLQLQ